MNLFKKICDILNSDEGDRSFIHQRPEPTTERPGIREVHEHIAITEKGRQYLSGELAICKVCGRTLPNYGFEDDVCLDCQH